MTPSETAAVIDRHLDSILKYPGGHGDAFGVEILLLTLIEIRAELLGIEKIDDYSSGAARGKYMRWCHRTFPDKAGPLFLTHYLKKVTPPVEGTRYDILLAGAVATAMEPFIRSSQKEQDSQQ